MTQDRPQLLATIILICAVMACPLFAAGSTSTLSPEELIEYQTRIEQLYWNQRTWPAENPGSKPELAEVMSPDEIRAKVERSLLEEELLSSRWGVTISEDEIQAELDRIARASKAPRRLLRMFEALDNDPVAVAEVIVKPLLVDRAIREKFAFDPDIHGDLRALAEEALLAHPDVDDMHLLGGEHSEIILAREPGVAEGNAEAPEPGRRLLAPDEWERRVADLPEGAPPVLSPLREDAERFFVIAVLERSSDEICVATVSWPKRSFDDWLESQPSPAPAMAVDWNPGSEEPGYSLPHVMAADCVDDTWTLMDAGLSPMGRDELSAVWTGSEMIVWGGETVDYDVVGSGGRYDPATDSWTPTSMTGAPEPRYYHSAVWTGTEMIIWGGSGDIEYNNGAKYDPSTDSWTPTSMTGAPEARYYHNTVWTGSEMIVWSGYNGSTNINSGGRYNPDTDSWTATSTSGAPAGRMWHEGVWTGSEMIVWGGRIWSTPGRLNTGGRYNPSTDTWSATSTGANVPSGRIYHRMVWTGSEMIVWGGYTDVSPYYTNTGGRYDPVGNTWSAMTTTDAPEARIYFTAVWTGSEMIVWGGETYSDYGVDTGGRYDPVADSWTATSASGAPGPRTNHAAVWTGSEMIVWGGYWEDPSYGDLNLDTGGRYNPSTDSWTATSTGPAGIPWQRQSPSAVWTGSEMIVWGGSDFFGDHLDTGGRYDPATDSWTPTSTGGNLPAARALHHALWTGTEMLIWGGEGDSLDGGRYDPATDSWSTVSLSGAPGRRANDSAVWTGSEMIIWGGNDYMTWTPLNTGARYDPSTDSWSATSTGADVPEPRNNHTAVWSGAEMIVWGGENSSYLFINNGGRYDPVSDSWTPTSTGVNVPTPRSWHAAVWGNGEMIIWSGYGNSGVTQTGGRYDPLTDSWTATSTAGECPAARTMRGPGPDVWTGKEMIIWGWGNDNTSARYDPATDSWSALSTGEDSPQLSRDYHTSIWTGLNSEMIIWAGMDDLGYNKFGHRYCAEVILTWYADDDSDGYGDPLDSVDSREQPPGYVLVSDDCDDTNANVNPGIVEEDLLCNDGLDNDCDGDSDSFDDGCGAAVCPDDDSDSYADCTVPGCDDTGLTCGDCDDSEPTANPGGTEVPDDGIDQDCNGADTITCWQDADQDGYGDDAGIPVLADDGSCDTAQSESDNTTDCDDGDAAINPAAMEVPDDGIDQDCSGADTITCYEDSDQDGYGDVAAIPVLAPDGSCDAAEGESTSTDDCNDGDPTVHPGAAEVPDDGIDQDCNGADTISCYEDADQDGYGGAPVVFADDGSCDTAQSEADFGGDCDDTNASINPDAAEVPDDGIDQDCNGADTITCYYDGDQDGYGDDSTLLADDGSCDVAQGESYIDGDCDNVDPLVNPGMAEIPDDGIDQDCNGADTITCYLDGDQDGYGTPNPIFADDGTCDTAQSEADNVDDCDDGDASTHPGATELCDGIDNDCDLVVPPEEADSDSDDYRVCENDCDDGDAGINPGATEIPGDGIDQNCDGQDNAICFEDLDGDGLGSTNTVVSSDADCDDPGESNLDTDCDDSLASVYPGATEVPDDGIDQDCNGADTISCYEDADRDGWGGTTVVLADDGSCDQSQFESGISSDCDDGDPGINPSAEEVPDDGIDQDCNGADTITCFADWDQDGYGHVGTIMADDGSCDTAQSESDNSLDCNNQNFTIYPGAPEVPDDGIDQDCNGEDTVTCYQDADHDGFGSTTVTMAPDGSCDTMQGEADNAMDCDDSSAAVYPGAAEVVDDGIDQDCSGADSITCFIDGDQDGYGGMETTVAADGSCDAAQSEASNSNDCADGNAAINPGAAEICDDTIDNDCDGLIDADDFLECGATVTVCHTLGDAPLSYELDEDVFRFTGQYGEEVTITLTAENGGEGSANLMLMGATPQALQLFTVDRSELPNAISVTLPVGDLYYIAVSEQPSGLFVPGPRFSGDYCLTLEASEGGAQTLTAMSSVESEGAPPPASGPGSRAQRHKSAAPMRNYRRAPKQER